MNIQPCQTVRPITGLSYANLYVSAPILVADRDHSIDFAATQHLPVEDACVSVVMEQRSNFCCGYHLMIMDWLRKDYKNSCDIPKPARVASNTKS